MSVFVLRPALLLAGSALAVGALVVATPVLAQPGWGGGWGRGGFDGPGGWDGPATASGADPREGRVQAESFVAPDGVDLLGRGRIAVQAGPGGSADERQEATFEAAIIDQLAKAGYDTLNPDPTGGQVTEVRLVRDVVVPEEPKKSPWSGAAEMGVSNHGSMMAVQLNYDASKPRKALVNTHLELRIRERTTGQPLYEGRADIVTREGDSHWSDGAIAARLAAAIFAKLPHGGPATPPPPPAAAVPIPIDPAPQPAAKPAS